MAVHNHLNSSFREPDRPFWPPWAVDTQVMHRLACRQNTLLHITLKRKVFFFSFSPKLNNYPTLLTATIVVFVLWDFFLAHECPHQHFFFSFPFIFLRQLLTLWTLWSGIHYAVPNPYSVSSFLSFLLLNYFSFSTWIVWYVPKSSTVSCFP